MNVLNIIQEYVNVNSVRRNKGIAVGKPQRRH